MGLKIIILGINTIKYAIVRKLGDTTGSRHLLVALRVDIVLAYSPILSKVWHALSIPRGVLVLIDL